MYLSKKINNYIFIGILLLIVVIGWVIHINVSQSGKHSVKITSAPNDATITINNNKVQSSSLHLANGTYTITAERAGFTPVTKEVTISNDTKTVAISLLPETDEAKKWIEDNPGAYSDDFSDISLQDPILRTLPYRNLLYSIEGVGSNNTAPIQISVSAIKGYRNAPIEYMKQLDIDPSNYIYNYNYESPFKQEKI